MKSISFGYTSIFHIIHGEYVQWCELIRTARDIDLQGEYNNIAR